MIGHTHSLADWAAYSSLGISAWALAAAVIWLTADAKASDFDPRPAVRHAAASVHQAAVFAGHDLNHAVALLALHARQARDRARRAAARCLLALLLRLTVSNGVNR